MSRNRRIGALAAAIGFSLYAVGAQAADRANLHRQDLAQLQQQYQQSVAQTGVPAKNHARHAQFLGADANTFLVLKKKTGNANGATNYRYQQTYLGVPVHGDTVVVSEDRNGNVRSLYGSLVQGIKLPSITPSLSGGDALAKAKGAWLGKNAGDYTLESASNRLVVFLSQGGDARLAYEVSYFAHSQTGNPTNPLVIVDAQSGDVLEKRENLQSDSVGTGPGGNAKTGKYGYGEAESGGVAVYDYLDVTVDGANCSFLNTNVRTVNNNHSTSTASTTPWSYSCPRNTVKEINGAYSPLNDGHHFGGVVFNMYSAWLGASPLAVQLRLLVHYGTGIDNAYWSPSAATMMFGDGSTYFYPLVSLDVTAHEVSHGYTTYNSNLAYSGMSGGINEAFSDIAGEAAEYFDRGENDFLIGADIAKHPALGGALRFMEDPTLDGASIGHVDDYYEGLNVHYSSGLYNRAFWNLAHTAGWDTQKAFMAFAIANRDYWTSSTDFFDGACGVEDAATALGYSAADVTAAMAVVGVECGGSLPVPEMTELFDETPVTDLSGGVKFFFIDVPINASNLTITMSGGTGDADLYLRYGALPGTSSGTYDCRPWLNGNNETCSISNPAFGTWYLMLDPYIDYTGVSLVANYTINPTPPTSGCNSYVAIEKGQTTSDIAGSTGCKQYFMIDVPEGASDLNFFLDAGTNDADMYIKRGAAPSLSVYDCAAASGANGEDEECQINNPAAGTWFVLVYAYNTISGYSLTVDYNEPDPADTTPPTISAAADRAPNGAGWYNKKVTVTWTCDDGAGSGVASCPDPKVYKANTTTDGVLSPAYTIFDNAGNESDPSNQLTIRIDKIKPTIGLELDSEPNEFGWYTGDVTVHYTCDDGLSGLASCPADTVITKRGVGVKVPKGKAVDVAGNAAPGEVTTINIDSTAPAISDVEFSGPLVVGAEVTASPVAADAQSGIASSSCDAVDTTKAKKYSVTCTVTNGAGLEKSKKFYYTVEAAE